MELYGYELYENIEEKIQEMEITPMRLLGKI